jgi:hypothetical protein
MILISHRGNINGQNPERENSPSYIDETIALGFEVEIDIWFKEGKLFLGHDEPQYEIDINWLEERKDYLWVHCKNVEAIVELINTKINCFFHYEDTITLTSNGTIWAFPGKQPIKKSVAVLPERNNDDLSVCIGICSDFIETYNKLK